MRSGTGGARNHGAHRESGASQDRRSRAQRMIDPFRSADNSLDNTPPSARGRHGVELRQKVAIQNLFDGPGAGVRQAQKPGLVQGFYARSGIGLRQAFGGISLERRAVVE